MTINTWRKEILGICKYCVYFIDRRQNRYRYQCDGHNCGVYEAYRCRKTFSRRKQVLVISNNTQDENFYALIGMEGTHR